ncbi:MAG: hypothetical protein HYY46_10400 [Deltaproteobacteria bacterium]|nr:hypothetical protein [Deltaproteobacteria bacterium]
MRGMYGLIGLVVFSMLGGIALAASPLDGTQWRLQMTTPSVKAPSENHVRFEKGKFNSPLFQPKGFPPSNYTLTEQKGAPLIWETMQTSATEGTLSWRGELEGDTMRGLASWRKPDGTVVNYTFSGRKVVESPANVTKPPAPKPKAKPREK